MMESSILPHTRRHPSSIVLTRIPPGPLLLLCPDVVTLELLFLFAFPVCTTNIDANPVHVAILESVFDRTLWDPAALPPS
jgi:hypothetical protein